MEWQSHIIVPGWLKKKVTAAILKELAADVHP